MFEGAVYEAVSECQGGNSPPDTGGVTPSRKSREATAAAKTGVVGIADVFRNAFLRFHSRPLLMLRPIGLALRALLCRERCKTSKSTVGAVYDRAYFLDSRKNAWS